MNPGRPRGVKQALTRIRACMSAHLRTPARGLNTESKFRQLGAAAGGPGGVGGSGEGGVKLNLVAIQAKPLMSDYANAEAFYQKMADLMGARVTSGPFLPPDARRLPGGHRPAAGVRAADLPPDRRCEDDRASADASASEEYAVLHARAAEFRTSVIRTVFLETALEAEDIYVTTFSTLAREYGVYLCAGCIFAAHRRGSGEGAAHGGPPRLQPVCLFNPNGVCLRRTPKINLAPPTEPRFEFSPGNRSDPCRSTRRSAGSARWCATTLFTVA